MFNINNRTTVFEETISIYAHARDATGQYIEECVDQATGEVTHVPIKTMTIHDFCLSDRFRDKVTALRKMQAEFGPEAKKLSEYDTLKRSLPAATLSGLFSYRRQADLVQHSGYIVLDMDWQDNRHNDYWLNWEDMKRKFFRHFPEIALCMRSCSGTGYFALVPLAYPDQHKAQARSIMTLYEQRGIYLDISCKDPTRLRFASWDDSPYINPKPRVYKDIDNSEPLRPVKHYTASYTSDAGSDAQKVERLVAIIEQRGIDITGGYDQCFRIGVALANMGYAGLSLWKRVCRFRSPSAHSHFITDAELERKWQSIGDPSTITIATFFKICRDNGVTLR